MRRPGTEVRRDRARARAARRARALARRPALTMLTSTVVAPASSAFSTSSLMAVARSSTTWPEQMRWTEAGSMGVMRGTGAGAGGGVMVWEAPALRFVWGFRAGRPGGGLVSHEGGGGQACVCVCGLRAVRAGVPRREMRHTQIKKWQRRAWLSHLFFTRGRVRRRAARSQPPAPAGHTAPTWLPTHHAPRPDRPDRAPAAALPSVPPSRMRRPRRPAPPPPGRLRCGARPVGCVPVPPAC